MKDEGNNKNLGSPNIKNQLQKEIGVSDWPPVSLFKNTINS